MSNIARLGDKTVGECVVHGTQNGVIIESSNTVSADGKGVARLGDKVLANCGHEGIISTASNTVSADGKGVSRLGDKTSGDYSATIVTASDTASAN